MGAIFQKQTQTLFVSGSELLIEMLLFTLFRKEKYRGNEWWQKGLWGGFPLWIHFRIGSTWIFSAQVFVSKGQTLT